MSSDQQIEEVFRRPPVRRKTNASHWLKADLTRKSRPEEHPEICNHLMNLDETCILKSLNQKVVSCVKCSAPAVFVCAERRCAFKDRSGFCNKSDHIFPHFRDNYHRIMLYLPKQILCCNICTKQVTAEKLFEYRDESLAMDDGVDWIDKTSLPLGATGLLNTGNTCYANAALQLLTHCPPLVQYFQNWQCKYTGMKDNFFADLFARFIKVMYSENRYPCLDPSELLHIVRGKTWNFFPGMQHDTQEFMKSFLDVLHNDIQQSTSQTESTIVSELFGGTMESCITCSECHNISVVKEDFTDLSLSLDDQESSDSIDLNGNEPPKEDGSLKLYAKSRSREIHLSECFDRFFRTTHLTGDNKYFCAICKKHVNAIKTLKLSEIPNVLSVQLKRFRYSEVLSTKIDNPVLSPFFDLDISNYSKTLTDAKYDLIGFITHEGSAPDCGHYIAYSRCANTMGWTHFEDSRVRKMDDVRNQRKKAYVMLYVKRGYDNRTELIDHPIDTSGPQCYVSKEWWINFRKGQCLPFDHSKILCEHGFFNPRISESDDNIVEISQEMYANMHKIVGGDQMLRSLDKCMTCHANIFNAEVKQLRISKMLNKDDEWAEICRRALPSAVYGTHLPDTMLNTLWLTDFDAYIGDPLLLEPGEISNKAFEKHLEVIGDSKIIKETIPNARQVILESYKILKAEFGGGPDVFKTDDAQPSKNDIEIAEKVVSESVSEALDNIENVLKQNEQESFPEEDEPGTSKPKLKKKSKNSK